MNQNNNEKYMKAEGVTDEMIGFPFDNSYARELSGFYAACLPEAKPEPDLLYLNRPLAEDLSLDVDLQDTPGLAALFSGNRLPEGAEPIAQAYAGHQFGHFSPQLGDGRALVIGEVVNRQGKRYDLCFKGSGRTPFSRGGDGKAAIGPMLREVLVGEAMHALGVPTTRSLAVTATGEPVYRDTVLPGAVLTRVAASHIRIGTFEFFAARGQQDRVKRLADYAIARHYPELLGKADSYLEFLRLVTRRQAALVAHWMSLGFIHGVMNTDNVSIAGETIDYGPCAFMEAYNPNAVFSSIDAQGRYAYGNQPPIAQWNLARLAETLLPLLSEDQHRSVALANEVLESFPETYRHDWLDIMRAKLGLMGGTDQDLLVDTALIDEWLTLLQADKADYTLAWRRLADAAEGQLSGLRDLFPEPTALDAWLVKWQTRCAELDRGRVSMNGMDSAQRRGKAMREVNPWLIPRNHHVEEALAAASDESNLEPFEELLAALLRPYDENLDQAKFAAPAPDSFTARYRTFCGT
jgi:uncharacterized protein YdiU (UPF0061 family)